MPQFENECNAFFLNCKGTFFERKLPKNINWPEEKNEKNIIVLFRLSFDSRVLFSILIRFAEGYRVEERFHTLFAIYQRNNH